MNQKEDQKEIKAMKKEVQEESAINVGYTTTIVGDIINELGDSFITSVLGSELGEELVQKAKKGQDAEAMNIFVTEAVRQMTYSDFKIIAHNFFSYQRQDDEVLSKFITPTEEFYELVTSTPEALLEEKTALSLAEDSEQLTRVEQKQVSQEVVPRLSNNK